MCAGLVASLVFNSELIVKRIIDIRPGLQSRLRRTRIHSPGERALGGHAARSVPRLSLR